MAGDKSLGNYFKGLSKAIKDLKNRVIGGIEEGLDEEAEIAAEEIRLALEEVIGEIASNRSAGALVGYTAIKEKVGENAKIRLPKSKVSIATGAKWLVTVVPSAAHRNIGLNVFNILDEGRKALPKRTTRPYVLPNAGPVLLGGDNISVGRRSNARVPDSGDKFSGSNPHFASVRNEPRREGQIVPGAPFSMGPIRAVAAKNLYKRAEDRAQKRLILKNLKAWDVVLVGNFDA